MNDDWSALSASELGRLIGHGEIDPRELTEAYLGRMRAHPDLESIYVRVTGTRAMAEADAASQRAKAGRRRSPLDGVPISWKDLFDTAGIATEAGSLLLQGRTPDRDSKSVRRAAALGLICLGKTNLSELAFSGLGLNPVTGTPGCINDPDAVPGGSSSGAALSVALGLAAAGIGSDTGGSVRVPAAYNDLVGLKTTSGLISLEGVVPLCTRFDTVGPLVRTVEDAAALLPVLTGRSVTPDLAGARIDSMRFLVIEEAVEGAREQPLEGFQRALDAIVDAGASIEYRSIKPVADAWPLSGCLYGVEAAGQWMDVINQNPDVMFSEVRKRFASGLEFTGTDYVKAWSRLKELRGDYLAAVAGFDAVLVPTSPILPPNRKRALEDSEYYTSENLLALRNTRIGNLMDLSSLTIPTGVPSAGIMLLGQPFGEARILRIGAGIETAMAAGSPAG